MCQGNIFIDFKKSCDCEPKSAKETQSKDELLARLKGYKRDIESELAVVKGKLGLDAPAEKGGE